MPRTQMTRSPRPVRVVQWATGNIGTRALRHVIEHPSLELVGVYVHDAAKAGRDAGDLAGVGPVGLAASADPDAVIASGPDCVLHTGRFPDVELWCRLLAAGVNVVTTAGLLHHPPSLDPAVRDRIVDACVAGGASIHPTGSSPGFITEAVPLVLTSVQRRLDRLTIDEYADLSQRPSPELLFDLMGFGRSPAAFDEARLQHGVHGWGPSLRAVADALGIRVDELRASGEVALTPTSIEVAAGSVAAGTVAGQRVSVAAISDGQEVLRFRATYFLTHRLEPQEGTAPWNLLATGWRVSVEGDAPLEVDVRLPIELDQMAEVAPGYTANRAVNAVPFVVAAPPGIVTTVDLPNVIADLR